MTQEELRKELSKIIYADRESYSVDMNGIMHLINQHVKEVIGESSEDFADELAEIAYKRLRLEGKVVFGDIRRFLQAEQRRRAELE